MKHTKKFLEKQIKELDDYLKKGGIKDVQHLLNELKKELEIINKL